LNYANFYAVNSILSNILKTYISYYNGLKTLCLVALFSVTSMANGQIISAPFHSDSTSTDSLKTSIKNTLSDKLTSNPLDSSLSAPRLKNELATVPKSKLVTFKEYFNLGSFKGKISPDSLASDSSSKLDLLKEKVTSSKLMPQLGGSITSESYYTNFLDPYTRSESAYSRLYGSPSVEILGLPFLVDFYYTSEDNSLFNSNYISLDFDINKYRQNLEQKFREKIEEQVNASKQSATDLFDVSKGEQLLQKNLSIQQAKLANLKNELTSMDIDTSQIRSMVLTKKDSLTSLDIDTSQIRTIIIAKKDSLTSLAKDSLGNVKNATLPSADSLKTDIHYLKAMAIKDSLERTEAQIRELEAKVIATKEKYDKLKHLNSQIKDSLSDLRNQYSSKDFLLAKLKKTEAGSKAANIISKVKSFQLGLTNPILSEYTLNGIPVKGLNTEYDFRSNNVKLAVGRTFRNQFNTFGMGQPKPTFDRNVIGIRTEKTWGKSEKFSSALTSVSFFDNQASESQKQNILHALDLNSKISSKVELNLSLNHAIYKDENTLNLTGTLNDGQDVVLDKFQQFIDHFAVEGGIDYKVTKALKLEASYKRVSPEYITLGNPFLRNNFHELDVKAKLKLFKRKITFTSFYKKFEDNITDLSEVTNQMSGYGLALRSNFRKALNFSFNYTPYQQGNNSPDTLFRTDNQLAMTTANVIYNKKLKSSTLTTVLTYVNSQVDYNDGQVLVNNQMYLASVNWSNKKINFSSSFSRNLTGPTIDTLNFYGARIGLMQKGGDKVNFAISSFYDGFDYGGIRHRTTLQARFSLIPKLESTISAEMGQIIGLYGIDHKEVIGFRMLLKYQL
jgi:hypothetical protein